MMDKLQEAETLFMDGTFYVCPSLWSQLYSIHCLDDDVMYPGVYALFPRKSKETLC